MSRLLLDTCACLWLLADAPVSPVATEAIEAAAVGGEILVSPITAWEVALLVAKRRLRLQSDVAHWFDRLAERDGVTVLALSADILVASTLLPQPLHGDPADRILIASARATGARLVTRDQALIDYAALGHIDVLVC